MTDSELFSVWAWSLGVAAIVVLIAAALLIAILLTARSIREHAREAEEAVERIADHSQVILTLDESSQITADIRHTAADLESQTERIADAFQRESQQVRG